MLEELFYIHRKVVEGVPLDFKRSLFTVIDWGSPPLCIFGPRGTGKTTMLLQHYHEKYHDVEKCLYISADNVEISALGLFKIAKEYFKYGGQALIIDEIHKYPSWAVELKNIIDTFKNKEILVSGSSSSELAQGKTDLSRRLVYYRLNGLSFREYLELKEGIRLPILSLNNIFESHVKITQEIVTLGPILKFFKNYLTAGYYPFFVEGDQTYLSKVLNIIEKALYEDVAAAGNIKKSSIHVLKKILWLVSTSVPFSINIEKLSRDLGISKEYVYVYLRYLEEAGLINSLRSAQKGRSAVRKPEKIWMENTNLLFAVNHELRSEGERGMVRETYFVNQLKGRAQMSLSPIGDFSVAGKQVVEVGGSGKTNRQIRSIKNSYIAADEIEIGALNKIPLYLFGMLY